MHAADGRKTLRIIIIMIIMQIWHKNSNFEGLKFDDDIKSFPFKAQ
jgi:hypothetical protein